LIDRNRTELLARARSWSHDGHTCFNSRGVLISGACLSMYRSRAAWSIGCRTIPAMATTDRCKEDASNKEKHRPRQAFSYSGLDSLRQNPDLAEVEPWRNYPGPLRRRQRKVSRDSLGQARPLNASLDQYLEFHLPSTI